MRAPVFVAVLLLAAATAFSATLHVCPDGSGDYPTIQAAVDAAASGDTIELCDGTFTGEGNWDIDFGTKELVLTSLNGYEATIVDCGGYWWAEHRGIIIEGGQTAATRIEGITIQYSVTEGDGGALRCVGASPVIRAVRIRDGIGNASTRGVGIFVEGGDLLIEDCVIGGNTNKADGPGAAIYPSVPM